MKEFAKLNRMFVSGAAPTEQFAWIRIESEYSICRGFPHEEDAAILGELTKIDQRMSRISPWIKIGEPKAKNLHVYSPGSKNRLLFRDLAVIKSRLQLLGFVREWGPLISPVEFVEVPEGKIPPSVLVSGPVEYGFAWDEVSRQLAALRRVVEIWDLVQELNLKALAEQFGIDLSPSKTSKKPRTKSSSKDRGASQHEVLAVARGFIGDLLNDYLPLGNVPAVLPDANAPERYLIGSAPSDLFGLCWAQFAEAFVLGRRVSFCQQCGKRIEIAPGRGRPDKKFCSPVCRLRAHRQNRTVR